MVSTDQTELRLPPLALAKGGLHCPEHGLQRAQTLTHPTPNGLPHTLPLTGYNVHRPSHTLTLTGYKVHRPHTP